MIELHVIARCGVNGSCGSDIFEAAAAGIDAMHMHRQADQLHRPLTGPQRAHGLVISGVISSRPVQ